MRQIGTLPAEHEARRFGDYLLARGIKSNVEADNGEWAVWIYEEDDVDPAREELARYREQPDADMYAEAAEAAAGLRREKVRREKQLRRDRHDVVDVRQTWSRPMASSRCPVTLILLVITTIATVGTRFGKDRNEVFRSFTITEFRTEGGYHRWQPGLPEVQSGQIWRLITPIFLHLDLLHFAFGMLMTHFFGTLVESRRGSLRMLAFVLVFAFVSNLTQYALVSPAFGGMSGVLYGLFGYAWMKSRFQPSLGLFVPPSTIAILMIWFVVGLVAPMNIANGAHAGGLVAGLAIGFAPVAARNLRR
ncbi:MAG: rhomboid family intramembrane serine protease [Planctomycetes bacterium]|nr:rhomboid family intramembrane serine protease [Planctomycetota bacterium]